MKQKEQNNKKGDAPDAEGGSRGVAAVVVAIIAVSTSAIMIRYAQSGPLTISFYRLLFTTLLVLPWAAWSCRTELRSLDRATVLRLAATGLALAIHFALWVASVKMTKVANSVVLVTSHPPFVAAISAFFFKEYTRKIALLGGLLAGVGVLILFMSDLSADGLLGDLLAFGGGLTAGIYIVMGRNERKKLSTPTYCVVVYGFCTLFLAPLAFLETGFVPAVQGDWPLFLLMAIVPGILGHTLYNYALGHVPAFFVSTSLLGEPVGSTLMAALLFSEIPSQLALVGIPFIFAGIILAAWGSAGNKKGVSAVS
jgi:drug/metabolite transporter (DMT)-like permease